MNDWYFLQYFGWFPQLALIERLYKIRNLNNINIDHPNFDGTTIGWYYRGTGKRLNFIFDFESVNIVMEWKQDRISSYNEIISPTNEQILEKMKWIIEP